MSVRPGKRLTIVVGASSGIGAHLAGRAADQGHRVLAGARRATELEKMAEGRPEIELAVGDFLSAGADLSQLTTRLRDHDGSVSLIVTAATIGPVGPLTSVDPDEWSRAFDHNVAGPARLLAATLPLLASDDVVVFFSGGGVGGPNPQPNVSAYTTGKAALLHLVEVVAREHPGGPTVIAVAPGAFPTGFTDAVLAADPARAGPALLADVSRTRAAPFDPSALDTVLDYLESTPVRWLSGRTISARRDHPGALEALDTDRRASPDLFRLRRVDGTGVTVQAW